MVQQVADFMDGMPPMLLVMVLLIPATPLVVVLHELGHALAALWRTSGPVFVRIKASQDWLTLRAGRFAMAAGPSELPLADGFCAYDNRGASPLSRAIIAIAGPLASLLGAVVTAALWGATGGPLRDYFWVATLGGVLTGVINVLPLRIEGTNCGTRNSARLDGRQALDALCELRRPRPIAIAEPQDVKAAPVAARWVAEVDAAAEQARAQRARANVTRLRDREAERQAGSVPPPQF